MYPVLWAIDHAPVYDAEERAVLVALVVKGDFDGMNCFRSYPTLAAAARVDAKTAGRKCRAMEARGILRRQEKHRSRVWLSIPKEQRPVIWEVMIPAEWWSAAQLESINEQRAGLGRPEITLQTRPALKPAPAKKSRADKGVKRPKKAPRVAVAVTHPGTSSPGGGDFKSLPQGLQVPQPSESPSESPSETDQAAAARSAGDVRRTGAGSGARGPATSGGAAPDEGSPSEVRDGSGPGPEVPGQRAQSAELPGEQVAVVKQVVASLPAELVALLPYGGLPKRNRRQVLEAMAGRTVLQVVARAARRWVEHGYADAFHSVDGKGIGSAVGVVVALVKPGECAYARCEDGTDIDTGRECPACVERRAERRAARRAAAEAGRQIPVARTAARRPGWWVCTVCETPGKGAAPSQGECGRCRAEVESTAQALHLQLERDAAKKQAETGRAAAFALGLDEEAAYREAAERAERHEQDLDRAARKQADDEETARLRAELAAQYPDLAAVSGSARETQEAQQPLPAPF